MPELCDSQSEELKSKQAPKSIRLDRVGLVDPAEIANVAELAFGMKLPFFQRLRKNANRKRTDRKVETKG